MHPPTHLSADDAGAPRKVKSRGTGGAWRSARDQQEQQSEKRERVARQQSCCSSKPGIEATAATTASTTAATVPTNPPGYDSIARCDVRRARPWVVHRI